MIKIFLSKRREGERRHVVLTATAAEGRSIHPIIIREVLQGRYRPEREYYNERQMVRYRFAQRHLERLLLTVPFAGISQGLHRQMVRIARMEYEQEDVPVLNIPGFRGDLYDFQKIAVGRVIEQMDLDGSFCENDDLGLGKTYVAL